MKKSVLFIIILALALSGIVHAQVVKGVSRGTVASQAAAGTWYYNETSFPDTITEDFYSDSMGGYAQIGAATNITQIAFKVIAVGNATSYDVALYDNASPGALLGWSTCTPSANSWCIANVSYTASANATYKVIFQANAFGGSATVAGVSAGGHGVYKDPRWTQGSPTSSITWTSTTYTKSMAIAICTGTCSAGPTK